MIYPAKNYPINCGLANSTFNRTFTKRSVSDRRFDLIAFPIQRIISQASTTIIYKDKNGGTSGTPLKVYERATPASYVTDYLISPAIRSEGYFQKISLFSSNTNILSNPSNNLTTYQSNGSCIITGVSEDGESSSISVTASSIASATIETFTSWASGSAGKHCTDEINSMIDNKSQLNLYTNYQYYGPNDFVRNPNCWANSIDLSCASPWNSEAGALYAGTLVSPRHVIFCDHASFYPKNGRNIFFVSSNGTVIQRTIINSAKASIADIRVALLDSDVDSGVQYAKVLPSNWSNYITGLNFDSMIPVICLNQRERASISMLRNLSLNFTNSYATEYATYYGEIILYDSGNPVFLVINGQPVLIGVFTSGGAGAGSFISHYINAVNSVMASLGGGYQLTPVDLSQFNNYG